MPPAVPVPLPPPDPFNVQDVKNFVFNETGNIMMASTDGKSDTIEQPVRDVFAEVSVFFAAMTKAISQTPNPHATPDPVTKQLPYYSLYNYDALESVIDGSGYFVHVHEEDVSYATSAWGVQFSEELFTAILGLAAGAGALGFASAMVASMGQEGLNIQSQQTSRTGKVGNIVFVCEYLLGMPIVSAVVVTLDVQQHLETLQVGPCFNQNAGQQTVTVHKDTYMFVTPTFIKQFAQDLNSGTNDPAYLNLITTLEGLVERTPRITGVYDVTNPNQPPVLVDAAKTSLLPTSSYAVYGQYLGQAAAGKTAITLDPGGNGLTVTQSGWDDAGVTFTVGNSNGADAQGQAIKLTLADGTTAETTARFTIAHS